MAAALAAEAVVGSALEEYDPKNDVKAVADYFNEKYGDLGNALKNFEPDAEFDMCTFEAALKKWGVKVDNVVELFGHIDLDWSGTVSMQELFAVLELPMQEAKEREESRLRNEVNRVGEQIARSILNKFGSIHDYFEKERLKQGQGPEGAATRELSRARFAQLLRDLGLELDAKITQRVFSHIDNNNSGSVSMQELQAALNFNLGREILQELARHLKTKHGSATKPIEDLLQLNQWRLGESPRLPGQSASAGTPRDKPTATVAEAGALAAGTPAAVPAPGSPAIFGQKVGDAVTEASFLALLRRLDVINLLKEEVSKALYASLRPFSFEQLINGLKAADEEDKAHQKQAAEEERRRREKAKKDARVFNSRFYAQEDLKSWEQSRSGALLGFSEELGDMADARLPAGTSALPGGLAEDATRHWAAKARAGTSKSQLKDYISLLEDRVWGLEQELDRERDKLQRDEEDFDGLRDYLGNWQGQRLRLSTDVAEGSPGALSPNSTFQQTPGSRNTPRLGFGAGPRAPPVSKEVQVQRAERLVTAASSGDIATVQNLLSLRTDPNCAAWGGVTPLMAAAHHGRQAALEALLARQADLTLTDLHGRTALDHARRRPAVREWLRACGARGGRELAAEAEALARRVLLAGAERARLEALRARLPSEEVLHQAKLRRQLVDPDRAWQAAAAQPAWPTWSPGPSGSVASPQASPYTGSSLAGTPERRSARRGSSHPRPRKQVNIMPPSDGADWRSFRPFR